MGTAAGARLVPPLTPSDAQALAVFANRLREDLREHVVDIRLFGSKARGDATPESDIDVLVVVSAGLDRRRLQDQVVDLAFDVNLAHDVYISPRVVTEDALTDELELRSSFLGEALREGFRL